jgi:signal transduction histidine kinase/streptogramin lyase
VPGSANSLSDNNVWAVLKDRSGGLWVGTFSAGLNHMDPQSGRVTVYQHNPLDPGSLSSNEIRALLEDHTGTLWVGTERGGLDRFNAATNTFTQYLHDSGNPDSLSGNNVFTLFEDELDRLWVGTSDGGLNRMDQSTGTFIHYQHDAGNPNSLSDNNVRAIQSAHTSMIWVGTLGGLNLFYDQGNIFLKYLHYSIWPASLSSNLVVSFYEDNSGTLWIGTMGGGLNRYDRTQVIFSHFTVKDGLPDNSIYCILGDKDGNLWLSTNKGLSRFNPATHAIRNFDNGDGLQGNQFNPGACTQGQDGEMYFGGTNGLNSFYPAQVKDNPIPPPVVITSFQEFNKTVRTDLPSNETIQLSYRDNFISFDFSALDYNAPGKNQYAYRLDGVDKDWVYAGTRRYASYTNLGGGNYVFRVKASNNDGVWNSEGTSITIHITPPFWQTWWFIGMVCLVAGAGSYGGYRLRVRDVEARSRELAKRVEQRTHELVILNSIGVVVNSSLDLTEILNNTLEKTLEVMHMNAGGAFGLEELPEGPHFKLLAIRGMSDDYAKTVGSMPLSSVMMSKAIEAGRPLVIYGNEHPNLQIKEANEREGILLTVLLPLLVKGDLVGAITLAGRESREITPEELSLLAAIGQQVGMAVLNARLYEQAEQTAIMTERSRLARELHDSVTQLLYSVTLYAEAAAELLTSGEIETAAGHLRELRDTAQEALREMRLLIFELHRPALEKSGLAAALQARLDAVESRGGMHAELVVEGSEQIARPVQAELYNIAQEALNNALKHAHANSVVIHLRFGEEATEMEIIDDGVGFEPGEDRTSGGFGIPGMQERSQKISGALQINSAPGKGTSVIVRVAVNAKEQASLRGAGLPDE